MRNEEVCINPDRAHVADDPREIVFGMAGGRARGAAEIINERGGRRGRLGKDSCADEQASKRYC